MNYFATLRFAATGVVAVLGMMGVGACAGTAGEAAANASADPDASSDEVQIGYGSQERADVTGAVVSVRAEDLGREVTSFEDLFQGLAGITVRRLPSGGISLRIRGSPGFSSDGEPLYVINGVPIRAPPGQALMGVNPRDITRVDVLKDAAATSIYGSRGANGVVLIFMARQ